MTWSSLVTASLPKSTTLDHGHLHIYTCFFFSCSSQDSLTLPWPSIFKLSTPLIRKRNVTGKIPLWCRLGMFLALARASAQPDPFLTCFCNLMTTPCGSLLCVPHFLYPQQKLFFPAFKNT